MSASDLELLRRFEPVLCYTQGEEFFPTAIEGYLQRASLWATDPERPSRCLVAEGNLDPALLVQACACAPDATLH
ncbi:MAG: hypothetical protein JOY61_17075, partial [Chloroflexi bacterium]|nr:hypothetical protein [Chloroflexota bacterium]